MDMDEGKRNPKAFIKALEALLSSEIDETTKLKTSHFLRRIIQLVLSDENGRKAIPLGFFSIRRCIYNENKLNFILGSKINEVRKMVLEILCDLPTSLINDYFESSEHSLRVHMAILRDNEELNLLNLKVLEKVWDEFKVPYTSFVFRVGVQSAVPYTYKRELNEPEENYLNPDFTELSLKFPAQIPIKSPEEVILMPSAKISLRYLQNAPRLLYHFLKIDYEHPILDKVYRMLVDFLQTSPCISSNRNYYFTYTSKYLRAQIYLIELSVKLALSRPPGAQNIVQPSTVEAVFPPSAVDLVLPPEESGLPSSVSRPLRTESVVMSPRGKRLIEESDKPLGGEYASTLLRSKRPKTEPGCEPLKTESDSKQQKRLMEEESDSKLAEEEFPPKPLQSQPDYQPPLAESVFQLSSKRIKLEPVPESPKMEPCSKPPEKETPMSQPFSHPMDQPLSHPPTYQPVSQSPMYQPVSQSPMYQPVSQSPMYQPVSQSPMYQPVSQSPMYQPVSQPSTYQPVSQSPMEQPVSQPSTDQPFPLPPTDQPITQPPLNQPVPKWLLPPSSQPLPQWLIPPEGQPLPEWVLPLGGIPYPLPAVVQPPEVQHDLKYTFLSKAVEPFFHTWELSSSSAVYSQYALLRVLRLMLKTNIVNSPEFQQRCIVFRKEFYSYEKPSFPKHLRAKAIEEFLKLSKQCVFMPVLPTLEEKFKAVAFFLHAVCDQYLPLKIQVQLCDNLADVIHWILSSKNISQDNLQRSSDASEDMILTVMHKTFQTLVLKLKSVSNFGSPAERSNDNAGLDSNNGGPTLMEDESFSFIQFLKKINFEMCNEPQECVGYSHVDFKNMIVALIRTIHVVRSYRYYTGELYKSNEEKESFLPYYTGLLKYALRAIRMCNEENRLSDGFEEEKCKLFEHIGVVWLTLDGFKLRDMLTECSEELFKPKLISNTVEVFIHELLNSPRKNKQPEIVSIFLLEHLLSKISTFYDSDELDSFIPVYKALIDINYHKEYNNLEVIKAYAPKIILRSCKVSAHAKGAPALLELVNTFVSCFGWDLKTCTLFEPGNLEEHLKAWLEPTEAREILLDLKRLLRDTYNPIMKNNIISICLFIPYGFLEFEIISFVHELMPFVLIALTEEYRPLLLRGLKTLGELLKFPPSLEKIRCYRSDIAKHLYSVLRLELPPQLLTEPREHITVACSIISKLGPGNWIYGELSPVAYKTPMIRVAYEVNSSERTRVTFPIEKMIHSALNAAVKGTGSTRWNDCFTVIKYCYSALLDDSRRLGIKFQEYDIDESVTHPHKLVLKALLYCFYNLNWNLLDSYIEHYISQAFTVNIRDRYQVPYFNPFDLIDAIVEFVHGCPTHLDFGLECLGKIISISESRHPRDFVWGSEYILYTYNSIHSLFSCRSSLPRHFACMVINLFIEVAPLDWISQKLPDIFESLFLVGEELHVINTPQSIYYETIGKAMEFLCANKNQLFMDVPLRSINALLIEKLVMKKKSEDEDYHYHRIVLNQAWWCLMQLEISQESRLDVLSNILDSFISATESKSLLPLVESIELVSSHSLELNPVVLRKLDRFFCKCLDTCKKLRLCYGGYPERHYAPGLYYMNKELHKACMKALLMSFQHPSCAPLLPEIDLRILTEVMAAVNSADPDISHSAFIYMSCLTKTCDENELQQVLRAVVNSEQVLNTPLLTFRELRYLVYLFDIFKTGMHPDMKEKVVSMVNSGLELLLLDPTVNNGDPTVNIGAIARKEMLCSASEFKWVSSVPPTVFDTIFRVYLRFYTDCDSKFCYEFGKLLPKVIYTVSTDVLRPLFEAQNNMKEYREYFTNFLNSESREVFCRVLMENKFQELCFSKLAQPTDDYGFNSNSSWYLAIQIIYYVSKYNPAFLKDEHMLADSLFNIWMSADFQKVINELEVNDYRNFKVYKWLAKSLLIHFKFNENKIKLLFSLMMPLTRTLGQNFQFLRNFLHEVPSNYGDEWKNSAFQCFIELFHDDCFSLDVKSKFLQLVIIPSLAFSFSIPLAPHLVYNFIQETTRYCRHFHGSNDLKVQLLQLYCLLLKYGADLIASDKGCCGNFCLYRELLYFSKYCIWDGNRFHNLMLKSHGNLLLMHVLKYVENSSSEKIASHVLSNLCDVCPPDMQYIDLYIVQSLLKSNFAHKKLNFKNWAEELFANNLEEYAFLFLLNMLKHCLEVFNFQYRDFVTDFIEVANLSDFNRSLYKENKVLIYEVLMKFFEKIKKIDEEWVEEILADVESRDDLVREKNEYLFLLRTSPAPCSRRDVCLSKGPRDQGMMANLTEFFKQNTEAADETIDEPAVKMVDVKEVCRGFGFDEEELKSSIVKFQRKVTHTLLNYLLEFACQVPSDKNEESILEKCCSFLKSTLSSYCFSHFLDLNWWFQRNDNPVNKLGLRAVSVESDLLFHIILTKFNLEKSYKAELEALFKNLSTCFYENLVCVALFEYLKQYLEGNTADFDKRIHENMVLHIICFLLRGGSLGNLKIWNPKGSRRMNLLMDVLLVVDFSLISSDGKNLIKHQASRAIFDGIEGVPKEKILKVLAKAFELRWLDLFVYEMVYKMYLLLHTSKDVAKYLEFDDVIQKVLSCRWKVGFFAIIEKRGAKDRVPKVPSSAAYAVYQHFMLEDYYRFKEITFSSIMCQNFSLQKVAYLLASQTLDESRDNIPMWVACSILFSRMIPNETESAFPQNLLGLNLASNEFSTAIISLCFQYEVFSHFLWDRLIPQVWSLLKSTADLTNALVGYVDRHLEICNNEKRNLSTSLVAFTEGLLKIYPSPFQLDFHKKLGEQYHMWSKTGVLFHLEDQMYSGSFEEFWFQTLGEAYSLLDEHDMWSGLSKLFSRNQFYVSGITWEQQSLFEEACVKYQLGCGYEGSDLCKERLEKCERELSQWPHKLDNWKTKHLKYEDTSCICQDLWTIVKPIITHVNKFKTLSFDLDPRDCNGLCSTSKEHKNVEQVFDLGSEFMLRKWKILTQTISEAHVALLQAVMKIENARVAAKFQLTLKRGERILLSEIEKVFREWSGLEVTPHESISFHQELQALRLHMWNQLDWKSLGLLDKNGQILAELGESREKAIQKIRTQLVEVMAMHMVSAHTVVRVAGVSYTRDLKALEIFSKACYEQINFTDDRKKIREILQLALNFNTQALRIHMDHEGLKSIKQKILEDLVLLEDLEKDPRKFDAFFLFDRNFLLIENQFFSPNVTNAERLSLGVEAINCLLEGCRGKQKKDSVASIARIIFLLTIEEDLEDNVPRDKWDIVPLSYWVPWLSKLLTISLKNRKEYIKEIIKAVGKEYPQSLYVCLQAKRCSISGQEAIDIWNEINSCLRNDSLLLISTMDQIYAELSSFKQRNTNPVLQNLSEVLDELHGITWVSFKNRSDWNNMEFLWANLRARLDNVQSCLRFEEMAREMDDSDEREGGLLSVLTYIKKWWHFHSENFPTHARIDSKFLLSFHHESYGVELLTAGFDKAYENNKRKVQILQFFPRVKLVRKFNDVTYRFWIKGDNGQMYPYTFVSSPFLQPVGKEDNFNHFMSCLNLLLDEHKETARRQMSLQIPDIVTLSKEVHIIRDNPSSLLYSDICTESTPQDYDSVQSFYGGVAAILKRGDMYPLNERELFVQPKTYFKDWAKRTFENTTEYLRFRKQFARSLALFGFLKHVFGFTPQYPSSMLVHLDEGCITNIGYEFRYTNEGLKYDTDDNDDLVPLRLTPNISTFLTPAGVRGMFIPAITATASCLRKNHASVVRLIEMFVLHQVLFLQYPAASGSRRHRIPIVEETVLRNIISETAKSVTENIFGYMEDQRTTYGGDDCNIPSFVRKAEDALLLSRMDPVWLPWY